VKVTRLSFVLSLALLAGCGEGRDSAGTAADAGTNAAGQERWAEGSAGDGVVLAWVNGAPVYDAEIDFFLEERLNLLPFQTGDEGVREKVLESLVTGRAMAQIAEGELSEEDRRELAMNTAFYREEVLTKRYLAKHAQPTAVSHERVREYYESHPEEFGQRTLKEIEWLASLGSLDPEEREALLPSFQSLDNVSDWEGLAASANRGVVRVEYKRGFFSTELLDPRLATAIDSTAVGSASGLHMIDGRLHRIRVLEEKVRPAQSLGSVTDEIRRRLSPLAVRESVQKASDSATAEVEIRYAKTAEGK
jgi:hypothetical protein